MSRPVLKITPEQLRDGYRIHVGEVNEDGTLKVRRGEYHVISRERDGTYIVHDPSAR